MITVHRSPPCPAWDAYVDVHPAASTYHVAEWPITLAGIFGLEAFYLTAETPDGRVTGVLPLIRQRSVLFGDRLTSLPFVNYGGILADDEASRCGLLEHATNLARQLGVDRIELRETTPAPVGWSCRSDKATLRMPLPSSEDDLLKGFGSKLRSQVKRAGRDPYEVRAGGTDCVGDFYPVFAEVMRDLGTPVYPRRFFDALSARLARFCTILTIHRDGRPVAGAFLVSNRGTLEIPWAATVASEKPKATNMLLYAEVLKLAVRSGYAAFDFGRSTIDSGPYRFKRQWGAEPVQLHWAAWPPDAHLPQQGGPSLMDRATRAWSRLPLSIANRLGPLISPSLPW